MQDRLTVVICTRNRAAHLEKCVEALLHQSVSEDAFDILIVDNASTDSTPELATAWSDAHPQIEWVHEPKVGLSYARNIGFASVKSEWVAYLDDDGVPHLDWVEKLLDRIDVGDWDGIGGHYGPYFEGEPPDWYLPRYNSNDWLLREGTSDYEIFASDSKFSGGNCTYRRSALVALGGFSTELGMRDGHIGYGEEVDLQDRMLVAGHRLGFDAEIRMDHFTPREKQRLLSFVHRSFSNGRDIESAGAARHPAPWRRLAWVVFREGIRMLRAEGGAFAASLKQLVLRRYRWQNAFIDCSAPVADYLGRLTGVAGEARKRRRRPDAR
jgi:glycosyltransferase involved in cell wall biosynthesis